MSTPEIPRVSRREAIQWVLAASASLALTRHSLSGAEAATTTATAKPYGTDPLLNHIYKPGELWPLTLSPDQERTVTALCDLIIPADEKSPAASSVGVPAFIDEWISAPYPPQRTDREVILNGLKWLETESQKRFHKGFTELTPTEQSTIAEDICWVGKAKPEFKSAAEFFHLFRDLTATGFYTTPVGRKDVGFVGNIAMARFPDPPKEALEKLGLV
jgi:hypothetical protein